MSYANDDKIISKVVCAPTVPVADRAIRIKMDADSRRWELEMAVRNAKLMAKAAALLCDLLKVEYIDEHSTVGDILSEVERGLEIGPRL